MRIHLLISTLIFTIFTTVWLLNYPDFEFKGMNFKDKFEDFQFTLPIILDLIKFIAGIVFSLYFFSLIAFIFSKNINILSKKKFSNIFLIITAWLLITASILSVTSLSYPNLFFSHHSWANSYLVTLLLLILFLSLLSSFIVRKNRIKTTLVIFPIILINLPTLNSLNYKDDKSSQKNIIIIGIDSLNTSLINKENTPFISNFANKSLHLPNTYTHVARTFPSWVTILTGDYPTSNKARLNLTNLERLNLKETLSYFLKQQGYKTYFSLDERRFSHIDRSFYFDKIIGPPETADELVLSQLVENPMLAITSQFPFFKYFMPQLYNNRGAWKNYSPISFNKELEAKIKNEGIPVFISSHFTLPHWPYKTKYNTSDNKDSYGKYIDSIKLADKQVKRYYKHLENEGFLNNAIVFIITDHGESFGRKIDQPKNSNNSMNIPGHGNSIISKSQFNVLLTLKVYSDGNEIKQDIKNRKINFALSDITPTILDLINYTPNKHFDGRSIFKVNEERFFPLESSLKPSFNANGAINLKETIRNGISLYNIDERGRVVLKDSLYSDFIKVKQRGVIYKKWQISIYPELDDSIFITDLENNYLYSFNDFEKKELATILLHNLCSLFAEDDFDAKAKYCKQKYNLYLNGSMYGKAI